MVSKIGHRGAAGHEPENTIISFKKAIEFGVDFIELDVHLSKDKHLIVMHDDKLDRTTNGKGRICDKTLEEIKSYRTIAKNQQIPTLQEIIDCVKGKTKINIEIKGVEPAKEVAMLIKKNKIVNDVIVSSNYVKSLLTVKEIVPEVKTALLYYAMRTDFREYIFVLFSMFLFPLTKLIILKRASSANAEYVHIPYPFATKCFIDKLHRLGYKVNVWVVNNRETVEKMLTRNVDGIMSNYPDIL